MGITALLDGATTTQLTLDTGVSGARTIEYRAFDQSGLMGSATRTVIVNAANDSTPIVPMAATGTEGTSTFQ